MRKTPPLRLRRSCCSPERIRPKARKLRGTPYVTEQTAAPIPFVAIASAKKIILCYREVPPFPSKRAGFFLTYRFRCSATTSRVQRNSTAVFLRTTAYGPTATKRETRRRRGRERIKDDITLRVSLLVAINLGFRQPPIDLIRFEISST